MVRREMPCAERGDRVSGLRSGPEDPVYQGSGQSYAGARFGVSFEASTIDHIDPTSAVGTGLPHIQSG